MARRNPRPEATQEKILTPLKECCEQCGQPLWVANHSHRTVTTLSGLWKLTLVVRQCIEPTCPRFHQRYRPEEEGRLPAAAWRIRLGSDCASSVNGVFANTAACLKCIRRSWREASVWRSAV